MKASIASIETFSVFDGPGIRTVIFFNGCTLRCIYCHNPEMFKMGEKNTSVNQLVNIIKKNKDYYKDNGGVTFSGGEPLLHQDFLIKVCKRLKKEGINTALDTAGVGLGNYKKLLKYIDLIILDIKHVEIDGYKLITGRTMEKVAEFIKEANNMNKKFWIRQVIVPGIMDNKEYLKKLGNYLKQFNNIEKIEFLPYHKLGREKYIKLGLKYKLDNTKEMDKEECNKLYNKFIKEYL